jgi:hypothetical protein
MKYKGIANAWRVIIKEEGAFALFKGMSPTIMVNKPNNNYFK